MLMLMKLSSMYFFSSVSFLLFVFCKHSTHRYSQYSYLFDVFQHGAKSASRHRVNMMSLIVELDLQEVLDVDLVHIVDDVLIVEQTRIAQAALARTARRNLNALRRNLELTRVRLSPTTTLRGMIALCVYTHKNKHVLIRNEKCSKFF